MACVRAPGAHRPGLERTGNGLTCCRWRHPEYHHMPEEVLDEPEVPLTALLPGFKGMPLLSIPAPLLLTLFPHSLLDA